MISGAAVAAMCLGAACCSAPTARYSTPELAAARNSPSASLTTSDLVGPDGQCSGGRTPQSSLGITGLLAFQAGPEVSGPAQGPARAGETSIPAGRGIALEMSECEVLRIVGQAEKLEISANEHGDRVVIVTYAQGVHAGTYRFLSGRLKSIERLPEASEPATAAKNKPQRKRTAN